MELFKPGRQFDFMGQRKFWITLSIALVAISTILCFYPGPNYGTDFRGGTEKEGAFKKHVDAGALPKGDEERGVSAPGELRKAIESSGFSAPDVVKIVDPQNQDHFIIRVPDVSVVDESSKDKLRQ